MGNTLGIPSGPVPVEKVLALCVDGTFADEVATQRRILDASEPKKMSREERRAATEAELRKHGVATPTPADISIDELRNALAAVSLDTFWQQNARLHPNYGRVKNWLYVHEKYREHLDDLEKESKGVCASPDERCCLYNPSDPVGARVKVRQDVGKHFEDLVAKMKEHHEFEEKQLFAFYKKEGAKMYAKDDYHQLMAAIKGLQDDHDMRSEIFVRKAFDDYDAKKTGGKWQQERQIGQQMEAYNIVTKNHMEREETVLVRRWMELTDDQYKLYRTYLSTKYAMVY